MANVIDKLVIELGLDPKQFNDAQKRTVEDFKKGAQEATKQAKAVEEAQKGLNETLSKSIRYALTFFAILTGARSLKDFTTDLISADAALGRFSRNMSESPQDIAAWGMAAERFGGSAEATAATIQKLGESLYQLHRNGQMLPKEFSQIQALTGRQLDTEHGSIKYIQSLSGAIKQLSETNPSEYYFLAKEMGIDDGTINLMVRYGDQIDKYIEQQKKLAPSREAIEAAQALQEKWKQLQQTAVALGNSVMTFLGPELEKLLTKMTQWVEKNQDWLKTEIVQGVKDFAEYIKSVDWKEIGSGMSAFAQEAKGVVDALGGIVKATEVILALWAGSKMIGALATLRTAIGGGAAASAAGAGAGAGGGLLAGLMAFAAARLAGPAAFFYATGTNEGEDERMAAQREKAKAMGWKPGDVSPLGPENSKEAIFQHMRGRAVYDLDNEESYRNGSLSISGRPVDKGNPLPVVMQEGQQQKGLFEKIGDTISSWFSPSSANAAETPAKRGQSSNIRHRGAKPAAAGTVDVGSANKDVVSYIREKARAMGIDENVALRVANHEGLRVFDPSKPDRGGDGGSSFGPFQLHYGGINPAMPRAGLGDEFTKATGLDARNPSTWKQQIDFALKWAKKHGWGPWMGAKAEGIYGFHGINRGGGDQSSLLTGARGAAMMSSIMNDNRSTKNSSVAAHIGSVTVNTQATDANGVASGMADALRKNLPSLANYGLA